MKVFNAALLAAACLGVTAGAALAQDATKGKSTFNQCMACHALDHAVVGPPLGGIIGRPAGATTGYAYSPLMKAAGEAGLVWNKDEMVEYLKNPSQYLKTFVTGKGKTATGSSKMVYMLASEDQRKNVTAYLESTKK